jgi:hypothetical protein
MLRKVHSFPVAEARRRKAMAVVERVAVGKRGKKKRAPKK